MKQMGKCFSVVFLALVVWSLAAFSPSLALAAKAAKVDKAK